MPRGGEVAGLGVGAVSQAAKDARGVANPIGPALQGAGRRHRLLEEAHVPDLDVAVAAADVGRQWRLASIVKLQRVELPTRVHEAALKCGGADIVECIAQDDGIV